MTAQEEVKASKIQDWTKLVTLNPPAAIIFKQGAEDKPFSMLELKNTSGHQILFKVKTTEPKRYIVRPNQGVLPPNSNISIKIICYLKVD